jgi:hypothetical protein
MFLPNGTRESVYLCDGSKIPDVDMDQLHKITKAGELIKRLRCKIVSRETYNRPDLVSCSVSEGITSIVVLGSALGPHNWSRDQYVIIADAQAAVENELEKVNTRICTITWPKDSSDWLPSCPQIPKAVRILQVRGLEAAFGDPTPTRWGPEDEYDGLSWHLGVNAGHRIHQFVRTFQYLEELMFEHICEDDLMNLREWLENTKVLQIK